MRKKDVTNYTMKAIFLFLHKYQKVPRAYLYLNLALMTRSSQTALFEREKVCQNTRKIHISSFHLKDNSIKISGFTSCRFLNKFAHIFLPNVLPKSV
jgi:hypothetical protein